MASWTGIYGLYTLVTALINKVNKMDSMARTIPESTSWQGDVPLDQGRHHRAKIGYVLLATEQTIQDDAMALRPDGVGVHFARLSNPDLITHETLLAQADNLAPAAASLLPDGSLDVVCYGCTSGSLVIGEERVHAELNRGAPNAKATSLIAGVIRALRTDGAKKIAVGTPYIKEINDAEAAYMEDAGFDDLSMTGLELETDSQMVRVPPQFLFDFAVSLDRPDADAVFISCGALRTSEVVEDIEQKIGKPVIVSNQAMIWDTLRLAGIADKINGYGTLFRDH